MKSASTALITLLNSGNEFYMADLYEFTLIDGTVLRYADYDIDVNYNGNLYTSSGTLFQRDKVRTVIGVEVDTMSLSLFPKATDLVAGIGWVQAAAKGILDGAVLKLQRVFMSSPSVIVGGFVNFSGRIADITLTRSEIQMVIKSDLELLNINMPRNLYQAGCQHTLYDTDCGANRASFSASGVVASGSTATMLLCGLIQVSGYFNLGYITFTTGAMAGTKRSVKSYDKGQVLLLNPLPLTPSLGDTFSIYSGCDKTQATCSGKFNNLANFRGFPFIPVPETTR